MTNCADFADRMPLLASRGSEPSPAEKAHLDACRECRAEWAIVQAASRLGGHTANVDADALTRRVLDRVASARTRDARAAWLRRAGAAGLAAAAVVLLAVLLRQPAGTVATGPDSAQAVTLLPLAELDGADAAQLEQVLAEFEGPISGQSSLDPGIDEMDPVQLDRALRAWEES